MPSAEKMIDHDIFPETPLRKLNYINLEDTWIKDESVNQTGTHKDRMAHEILKVYKQYFKPGLTTPLFPHQLPICSLISAGNAALAIATLFKNNNLPKLRVLLDHAVDKKSIDFLIKNHCDVFTTDIFSRALSKNDILELTDNPQGLDITSYSLLNNGNQLYSGLVDSILRIEPKTIILPYGSGVLFESFCRGIIQKQLSHQQRFAYTLIGVTTNNRYSKADKLFSAYAPFDLNASRLNFMKQFGYISHHSKIYSISEDRLDEAVLLLKENQIAAEYSGAVGLAYVLENEALFNPLERCVIINTGLGLFARFMQRSSSYVGA